MREEAGHDEHDDADDQHRDGVSRTSLPLFEDYAPDIGEDHVERHEDAEREGHQRRGVGQEALAERESEELAVPERSGEEAEEQVVGEHAGLAVVAPGMVLLILIEAVDGIGDEAAEGHEEGGRKCLEDVGRKVAEVDAAAEFESDVETSAHESREQRDCDALGEIEVLDGGFLLLLAQRRCLHRAGDTYDGDADEGDDHAEDHREGELRQGIVLGEEDVEQDGTHDGAESGAGAEGD